MIKGDSNKVSERMASVVVARNEQLLDGTARMSLKTRKPPEGIPWTSIQMIGPGALCPPNLDSTAGGRALARLIPVEFILSRMKAPLFHLSSTSDLEQYVGNLHTGVLREDLMGKPHDPSSFVTTRKWYGDRRDGHQNWSPDFFTSKIGSQRQLQFPLQVHANQDQNTVLLAECHTAQRQLSTRRPSDASFSRRSCVQECGHTFPALDPAMISRSPSNSVSCSYSANPLRIRGLVERSQARARVHPPSVLRYYAPSREHMSSSLSPCQAD